MNSFTYSIETSTYQDMFNDVVLIKWDSFENLINMDIKDTNDNYQSLLQLVLDKERVNVVVNIILDRYIIRYYELQLLPMKFIQSDMQLTGEDLPKLHTTFKVLKSEVNFVELADE